MKLKEIAAQTGVSPSAVSLVMHGRPGVGAAKREQIMRLLEENGYAADKPRLRPEDVLRTENTARAIRLLKCKRHAMLVDGNPGFISMIIDAISLECRRQGYELLVTTCSAADLPEIMRAVHAEQCGGVLLLGTELTDGDLRTLPQLPVPLVLLDNASAETDVNSITNG